MKRPKPKQKKIDIKLEDIKSIEKEDDNNR